MHKVLACLVAASLSTGCSDNQPSVTEHAQSDELARKISEEYNRLIGDGMNPGIYLALPSGETVTIETKFRFISPQRGFFKRVDRALITDKNGNSYEDAHGNGEIINHAREDVLEILEKCPTNTSAQ